MERRLCMDQVSEKELAALNELLSEEELLIKKIQNAFRAYTGPGSKIRIYGDFK